MTACAPVALFVYNRPAHTRRTLEAFARNPLAAQTALFVFADGPKFDAAEDERDRIAATRAVIRERPWGGRVHLIEAPENRGLAESIVGGVGHVLAGHDRVIVLEDDILTSPGFLPFMNRALELYADDAPVMHVSGYMYPLQLDHAGTVFLRVLSCWGWATWRRAWRHYDDDVAGHLARLDTPARVRSFNIEGHADFQRQLLDNRSGRIRSWAVRWYASWLARGGLSLFPTQSLVRNIGHDGSGVHCATDRRFDTPLAAHIPVERRPLREDRGVRWRIDEFYRTGHGERSASRIWLERRFVLPLRRRLAARFSPA